MPGALENERIDLVLCAGDITDKADVPALQTTWNDLNVVATELRAPLIATVGNHDVDSRHGLEIDPRGVLFDLNPLFPSNKDGAREEYWAKNYCIIEQSATTETLSWRVVSLNTSAFHGFSSDQGAELDFGRVSARTTARLERDLGERAPVDLQILLLHHHLRQLPDVDTRETGQVREADPLLLMLERTGPWVVVHGHKHRAYVQYAGGGGGSAVLFSAASMAAHAFGQLSSVAGQNQMHVLHFADLGAQAPLDIAVASEFKSWSWRPGFGWTPGDSSPGWPRQGGFGWRAAPQALARAIRSRLGQAQGMLDTSGLADFMPMLRYLSPVDLAQLVSELKRIGVGTILNGDGAIEVVQLNDTTVVPGGDQDG